MLNIKQTKNLTFVISCSSKNAAHMIKMVFCYQNCSDLLWEKNCSSDQERSLKFNTGGQKFSEFLRSLEQFIKTVKVQNNFW